MEMLEDDEATFRKSRSWIRQSHQHEDRRGMRCEWKQLVRLIIFGKVRGIVAFVATIPDGMI